MPEKVIAKRSVARRRLTPEKKPGPRSNNTMLRDMGRVGLTVTVTVNRANFLDFADSGDEITRSSAGKAWWALVDRFVRALREDEREAAPVKFHRYPDLKKEPWPLGGHALVGDLDVDSLVNYVKRIDEASEDGTNPRAIRTITGPRIGRQTLKFWRQFAEDALEIAQTEQAA